MKERKGAAAAPRIERQRDTHTDTHRHTVEEAKCSPRREGELTTRPKEEPAHAGSLRAVVLGELFHFSRLDVSAMHTIIRQATGPIGGRNSGCPKTLKTERMNKRRVVRVAKRRRVAKVRAPPSSLMKETDHSLTSNGNGPSRRARLHAVQR